MPQCQNVTIVYIPIGCLIFQHITYNEFLPIILGPTNMAAMKLIPGIERLNYDSSLDASISNAFATAAQRFGHSMVPNKLL